MRLLIIISWDWKEQPDWEKFSEALTHFTRGVAIAPVETGSDQYAVVIGAPPLTKEDAQDWWNVHQFD